MFIFEANICSEILLDIYLGIYRIKTFCCKKPFIFSNNISVQIFSTCNRSISDSSSIDVISESNEKFQMIKHETLNEHDLSLTLFTNFQLITRFREKIMQLIMFFDIS